MGRSRGGVARAYHQGTKHSEESLRRDQHFLDFGNQPIPFKLYTGLEPLPLIQEWTPQEFPALDALQLGMQGIRTTERLLNRSALSRLLYLSAGITKRKRYTGGEMYFRAAPNTGALYHIDLYLICAELPELEAGVYHFAPHDFALRRLRPGDQRSVLVEASGAEPAIAQAPVILASASTYWRNAWKYQTRAYRHCYWDAGTLHANLLAAATVEQLEAQRPHQRQQCRSRQVKVRQHPVHVLEAVRRRDQQLGAADDGFAQRRRIWQRRRERFERSHHGRADRDDAPRSTRWVVRLFDHLNGARLDRESLCVHRVLIERLGGDRLERAEADVEHHVDPSHASVLYFCQEFGCKVQAGRRRRHGPALARIGECRLIPLPIQRVADGHVAAGAQNVRRQWRPPGAVEHRRHALRSTGIDDPSLRSLLDEFQS